MVAGFGWAKPTRDRHAAIMHANALLLWLSNQRRRWSARIDGVQNEKPLDLSSVEEVIVNDVLEEKVVPALFLAKPLR